MAKRKIEDFESFVWKPGRLPCLLKDGNTDYALLNAVLQAALRWDKDAQMMVFEQYQGVWKKEITKFVVDMLSYEDAQGEAFVIFMVSLKTLQAIDAQTFGGYYQKALHIHLVKCAGHEYDTQKEIDFSLDETNEDGENIHDFPAADVDMDSLDEVKKRLTDLEFSLANFHYLMGYSLKQVAEMLDISYIYARRLNSVIKEKLKVMDR